MSAIFKREFRDYFSSLFGWIFIAALALAGGVISVALNIFSGSADFGVMFSVLPEVLLFLLPFLACQTFTREHTMHNRLWLASLPVRQGRLVLGKYAAMLALFLLPTALLAVFPPLLANFGAVSYGSAYAALAGYVLMGCALTAICGFAAACLHSRVVSVIVNLVLCAAIYLAPVAANLCARWPWFGLILGALACVGAGLWPVLRHRRVVAGILTAGIPLAVLVALYFLLPALYGSFLPELLNACSLVGLLGGFTIGHFDLPTAVYYLSLAVLFVFLTVQLQIKPERKGGDPR